MDNNQNIASTASQSARIRRWFIDHPEQELTSLSALRMFGCIELPKRVSELVAQGFPVQRDRTIVVESGARVKAYYTRRDDMIQFQHK